MSRSLPLHKRLLSYLYPVTMETANDGKTQSLSLQCYRGQYQLSTDDALYSDGRRYRPMVLAFDHLRNELPNINHVLLLGTGIASAAHILASKGYIPEFTFVEQDERILQWAVELLPDNLSKKVNPVCADAEKYMQGRQDKYDLAVVDVFIGRTVPGFVTSNAFLEQCRTAVLSGGHVVLNYIVNDKKEWEDAMNNIQHIFPVNKILKQDVNRVIIATV